MKIEVIARSISQDMILAAHDFEIYRKQIKNYLKKNNLCYDKFTTTENDSFIGYVSEKCVSNYIEKRYAKLGITVSSWESHYNIARIRNIISQDSSDSQDMQYVKDYFYDRYDLKIAYGDNEILVDVKSAETQKTPTNAWKFLYPVVQQQKTGKDYIILGYYIKKSQNVSDFKEFDLCGFMAKEEIETYPIQRQGTYTIQNTKSQIDNYITDVKDYKSIDQLIYNLIKKE